MPNFVFYRRNGSAVSFTFNGFSHTYWYYSTREAYRLFKEKVGIKRAKLIKDEHPITFGFLY